MKRYIRSSYEEDEYYTHFIADEIPEAVQQFMQTEEPDLDYHQVKEACDAFWAEYEMFPDPHKREILNMEYDEDKKRFYNKYNQFARRCKEIAKHISPSGYGRNDFMKLKMRDLLRAVDYNFPYGWKY